jgi:hypothetical protein
VARIIAHVSVARVIDRVKMTRVIDEVGMARIGYCVAMKADEILLNTPELPIGLKGVHRPPTPDISASQIWKIEGCRAVPGTESYPDGREKLLILTTFDGGTVTEEIPGWNKRARPPDK